MNFPVTNYSLSLSYTHRSLRDCFGAYKLFSKDVQSMFFIKKRLNKVEYERYKASPANKIKHTTTKLETKITTASEAARQEGGQAEGSPHASRSWPRPRLLTQVPPT
jgi:hypothetical protein